MRNIIIEQILTYFQINKSCAFITINLWIFLHPTNSFSLILTHDFHFPPAASYSCCMRLHLNFTLWFHSPHSFLVDSNVLCHLSAPQKSSNFQCVQLLTNRFLDGCSFHICMYTTIHLFVCHILCSMQCRRYHQNANEETTRATEGGKRRTNEKKIMTNYSKRKHTHADDSLFDKNERSFSHWFRRFIMI